MLWVRSVLFLFSQESRDMFYNTYFDGGRPDTHVKPLSWDIPLYNKIAKSFCEATGMTPEVFHATVIGNIEQAYREHISEMIAKHGWDPANHTGTFCETATKGILEMALEHEASNLGLTLWRDQDGLEDDPVDALAQ
jgi:hypothetical protein